MGKLEKQGGEILLDYSGAHCVVFSKLRGLELFRGFLVSLSDSNI
jgi:hypothetical protein